MGVRRGNSEITIRRLLAKHNLRRKGHSSDSDLELAVSRAVNEYWKNFGRGCQGAQGISSVQSRDAYKFLEMNPSSLSEEDRKREYASIIKKLEKINPQGSRHH
ncbi:hypothetical protein IRJ41_014286 [Triplophysa rosa]|uniref:Uncharacterized protein n=1 Tax=Triplophysa rosa TaxID=992332 RepID=A0A9W7WA22_TRIRA|nr:hypothetical protein IRJ41_014286 [Triplophysa rosa]